MKSRRIGGKVYHASGKTHYTHGAASREAERRRTREHGPQSARVVKFVTYKVFFREK